MNLIEIWNVVSGKGIELGIIVFLGMLGGIAQAFLKIDKTIDDNFDKVTLLMVDKVGARQRFEDNLLAELKHSNEIVIAEIRRTNESIRELVGTMMWITSDPDIKKRFIQSSDLLGKDIPK